MLVASHLLMPADPRWRRRIATRRTGGSGPKRAVVDQSVITQLTKFKTR
ncbi:hypothetical protein RSAG8_13276, partial [Rhizoctonia solani AG-8 WAC10335]